MLRFRCEAHQFWAGKLGLTTEALVRVRSAPTIEQAQERLDALRLAVKEKYHELVLDLHPDRHPGNAAKERQLKDLNAAKQVVDTFFSSVTLQRRQPLPMTAVYVVRYSQGMAATTSTVTSSGSTWFSGTWSVSTTA